MNSNNQPINTPEPPGSYVEKFLREVAARLCARGLPPRDAIRIAWRALSDEQRAALLADHAAVERIPS